MERLESNTMKGLLFKKSLESLMTLLCVATFVFLLMHLAPGSPFIDDHFMSDEMMTCMRKHYGLDKPFIIQYALFLKGIVTANLGPSLSFEGLTVMQIISQAFPVSLKLGSLSFLFSLTLGFSLSVFIVFSKSFFSKKLSKVLNTTCLAMPSFIAASVLQYVFAMKLNLLPVTGHYSLKHLILPALSLSLIPAGVIARLLKTKLQEVLKEPYTLSAKSKGLPPVRLFVFHLLPGALFPTLSYLGPLAATLLTGSFACEKVFALPGLGSWFVISLNARDYPLIAGLTLFYTCFVLGFSFIVDLLFAKFDPKVKREVYEKD
jgi:oligopeptide transport system permease protein